MDDVVSTVDALVSDEPTMSSYPYGIDSPLRSGTPAFPPGFGHIQPLLNATPPPPPGFSRPMTPVASMTPTNMNSQALPKPPVPVIPLFDPSTIKETQDTIKQQEEEQHKPQPQSVKREASRVASLASTIGETVATPAETAKAGKATDAAASSTPAPQEAPVPATPLSKLGKKASVLQDEDFPALDAAAMSATKPNKVAAQERPSKPSTPVGKKTAEKHPVPAVLNIAAASKPSAAKGSEASPAATEKHAATDATAFPSLPTPAAPWSPVVRSTPGHKSIRVVQVTKADTAAAPTGFAATAAADSIKNASASSTPTMTHAVLANRQPSALANRPSTPASEIVSLSDNASVVSASISASRAGSPPPPTSRIGSATVRTTTKSQQRKQRKQASKMDAAAVVEAATTTSTSLVGQAANEKEEEAVEIAPIMGRKKKQKKEKPVPAPAPAAIAPSETREGAAVEAAAPTKSQKEQKEQKETKNAKQSAAKKKEDAKEKASLAAAEPSKAAESTKGTAKNGSGSNLAAVAAPTEKVTAVTSAVPAAAVATAPLPVPVPSAYEKEQEILQAYLREAAEVSGSTTLSVAWENANGDAKPTEAELGDSIHNVAQNVISRGYVDAKSLDDLPLLQPFTKLSTVRDVDRKRPIKGDALLPPDVLFTKDDLDNIVAGKAVRKDVDDVRILATPNGDCLRNLTEDEENRFMALQHRVGVFMRSPVCYMHPRYEETGGFSLIAKRAVPCGLPSYYPAKTMAPPGTAGQIIFDPMSKIQREEAVYWINQYVLPRLNLLPQSEAASWQSMLVDTGVPQAIGTTTLAPWIYHTPEMRYGMPTTGVPSSSIPADNIVTNGHARGDHDTHPEDDVLTLSDGTPLPSSYHLRNPSRYAPTVDRDSSDLKNDLESSVHAMSVEDAERSLIEARREVKVFERALVQLVKMNEQLLKNDDLLASFSNGSNGGGSATAPAPLAAAALLGGDRLCHDRFGAAAVTALKTTGRVCTGFSATLLVLGWLLGGVVGVALGLAGWAGVVSVQVAGYVWDKVTTSDILGKEDQQTAMTSSAAAAVAVE
ncbi:transcriptional repressor proteinral negative regulator of transcription subunit 4 [Sporothrix eucalyptigena]